MNTEIVELLGSEAEALLGYTAKGISKDRLHLPGPDFVSRVFGPSDRSPRVLRSLQALYGHGRLANTGYLSILPVDQGVEHSGGASFSKNPDYFDPEKIVELAIEGGLQRGCIDFRGAWFGCPQVRAPDSFHRQ